MELKKENNFILTKTNVNAAITKRKNTSVQLLDFSMPYSWESGVLTFRCKYK